MKIDENIKSVLPEKYEVIKCFKKSSLGGVYLVKNSNNKKKFIIKVLDNLNADSESKNRFKREAKILSQIKHTNIIQIDDWGIENDISFISFEFFDSKNLREFVKTKELSNEEKLKITKQFFNGLSFLHKNNIIHRDIKPDNILVNEKLKLKISDFGLSLLLEDEFTTKINLIVGTPSYMSPEQIQSKKLTYQSDLFSAGALVYELYTNKNLFLSSDFNKTINNILNFNTSSLDKLKYTIPENILIILKRLLVVELDQRIKSAEEIISILEGNTGDSYKSSEFFRKKRIKIYTITTVVIALFIFLFTTFYSNRKPNNLRSKLTGNSSSKEQLIVSKKNNSEFKVPLSKKKNMNKKENKDIPKEIIDYKKVPRNIINTNVPLVTKDVSTVTKTKFKSIFIDSYPWAKVFIDDSLIDVTPITKKIKLKYGTYKVAFVHPGFPTIEKKLLINKNSDDSLILNLQKSLSYFSCKVFPWGNVFIDEKHLGQTPINKIIPVLPGKHKVTIKNPTFNNFTKVFDFIKNDTVSLNINFKNLN